jgi:hypothetical protein
MFDWETPDGYPDRVEYWSGNVLPRWNAMSTIANSSSGQIIVSDTVFTRFGSTPAAICDTIDAMAFGGEMNATLRSELTTYLTAGTINAARVRETLALAMSSSAFQWY